MELENGEEIQSCQEYEYLGVPLTKDRSLEKALRDRNVKRRKAIRLTNGME